MDEDSKERKVIIHVNDLWKSYDKIEVLKGLNLDIYDGETLVILGRSGVGKSVLLRQIIGIESPDKGSIDIDGKCITKMNQYTRFESTKDMGMLFQGSALFDSMNVGENTAFYLRQHFPRMAEKGIKERVDEALKMVGLEGTQKKMTSELSGGMRKRAALARVVIYRPRILLYDEPTTGLDPVTAMQINELINETKRKLKTTSIVVTHDIRSAMEVGDRLAFHYDGCIAHIAKKREFLDIPDPKLQAFFANAILSRETLENYR